MVRLLDPVGRKGTSRNPNKNYMWDFVDNSRINKEAHLEAVAIWQGWWWKPWKGFVRDNMVWTGNTTEGAHWEPIKSTLDNIEAPPLMLPEWESTASEKKLRHIAVAELNEACKKFVADPIGGRDNFYFSVYAFTRTSKLSNECFKLLDHAAEIHIDVDDVLTEFCIDILDRVEKGQYLDKYAFHTWVYFIWEHYFFAGFQTDVYEYRNKNTFVNALDEDDPDFEFESNCVAQSAIDNEQEHRENAGYAGRISGDRILRELDDPKTPMGQLSEGAKTILRLIADGRTQKEAAEESGYSEKQVLRLLNTARIKGQEMLKGTVLSIQGCADEDNLLEWPSEETFSIQACADSAPSRFLTAEEAAAYLGGLNSRTLTRWAREGYLPAIPIGEGKRRLWRFLQTDLEEWMLARRQGGQNAA
jgi:excisionase family DNA binding protein